MLQVPEAAACSKCILIPEERERRRGGALKLGTHKPISTFLLEIGDKVSSYNMMITFVEMNCSVKNSFTYFIRRVSCSEDPPSCFTELFRELRE